MKADLWSQLVVQAMNTPAGTVTHIDINHRHDCGDRFGDECDCNPDINTRRTN